MDQIDQVVLLVETLVEATIWFRETHGLDAIPSLAMPGYGLQGAVVPLGDSSFIHVIEAASPERAAETREGSAVIEGVRSGVRLASWAVRTEDIDAKAARLGLDAPVPGFFTIPGGSEVTWRTLGIERMMGNASLPFFIEWPHPDRLPGEREPKHDVQPRGIAWIELRGDEAEIGRWLGEHRMPIRVVAGEPPGVSAVAVATDHGTIVIR